MPKEVVQAETMAPEKAEADLRDARRVALKISEVPFQVNEAVNTLRANIQLSGYDLKIIGVTSALKHEGKSAVSFRLAKSFAALNKQTLYIDCDIRNSHTLSRYNVRKKVKGLTEFLVGECPLDEVIYKTSENCMDIIFTGAVAPNPSELFSGDRFK
ncbi:MAG: CpsD/CapB family tyrosine-protein kinase, partial [Clostridia bacterium]|nr:CpsD/CapB family tyrosine-protein kinase [Clostridia bacterium]